jgi:hypothetical protein
MNSVRFQDTKSTYKTSSIFYRPIMSCCKRSHASNLIHKSYTKYLAINLSKKFTNLYNENDKILMKDIKEDTKTNGKNSDAHKLEKLIL